MAQRTINSGWRTLAQRAAGRLGTSSPAIVNAILAQWTCEQRTSSWPPTRNNPGNVARGWAQAFSYPFTVQQPNPQPTNPIVTFNNPGAGADCYSDGLRTFSRYAGVRSAAARGDGPGYLKAITQAGYGTGYNCSMSVYVDLAAGRVTYSGSGNPTGTTVSSKCATMADYLSLPASSTFTKELLDSNVDRMARDTNEKRGDLYAFYVDFLGQPLSAVPCPTASFNDGSFGGAPRSPDPITGAVQALGGIGAHLAELAFIGILILMGVWLIVRDG